MGKYVVIKANEYSDSNYIIGQENNDILEPYVRHPRHDKNTFDKKITIELGDNDDGVAALAIAIIIRNALNTVSA